MVLQDLFHRFENGIWSTKLRIIDCSRHGQLIKLCGQDCSSARIYEDTLITKLTLILEHQVSHHKILYGEGPDCNYFPQDKMSYESYFFSLNTQPQSSAAGFAAYILSFFWAYFCYRWKSRECWHKTASWLENHKRAKEFVLFHEWEIDKRLPFQQNSKDSKAFEKHVNIRKHVIVLSIIMHYSQHGCHFTDNIFNCIFLNENIWTLVKISLKFVPKDPINNNQDLV